MEIPSTVELLEATVIHEVQIHQNPTDFPVPEVILCPDCSLPLQADTKARHGRIIVFCDEDHHWLATGQYPRRNAIELQRITPESHL